MKYIYILLITFSSLAYSQYSLWTWGSNTNGKLGTGSPEYKRIPTLVDSSKWKQVIHHYGIKEDGTLWSWGQHYYNGNTITNTKPYLFDDSKWKSIGFNRDFNYGIKEDGSIWVWGRTNNILEYSSIEYNLDSITKVLIQEPILFNDTKNWEEFSLYNLMFYGLDTDGNLFIWGNDKVFLGLENESAISTENVPQPFQIGSENKWVEIQVDNINLICKSKDSTIYFYGRNGANLGFGSDFIHFEKILEQPVVDYLVIDNLNGIYIMDTNQYVYKGVFQFDTELKRDEFGWQEIFRVNKDFKFIDQYEFAGGYERNYLYTFGWVSKEANPMHTHDMIYDELMSFSLDFEIGDISVLGNSVLCISKEGYLYVWGDNQRGQLGTGESMYYSEPQPVMAENSFREVVTDRNHSLAIDEHGFLWGWGKNIFTESQNVFGQYSVDRPVLVNYESDWKKVFSNYETIFAIKENGSLWSWGQEPSLFGYETEMQEIFIPKKIEGENWKQVANSREHVIAIKEDGTLWSWGDGPLGLGKIKDTSITPKQIFAGDELLESGWTAIGCGDGYSVAMRDDGSFWGWGQNEYGQFGDYRERIYDIPTYLKYPSELEISEFTSSEAYVTVRSEKANNLYHWGPWVCGFVAKNEKFNSRYLNSSVGINLAISIENELYGWYNFRFGRAESYLGINHWGVINKISDYDDWVKVDAGEEHIIGLRGEISTSVENQLERYNFSLYPNPSKNNFNINLDKYYNSLKLIILDINGNEILSSELGSRDKISFEHNLQSGMYFTQVISNNKIITTNKLIVR